MEIKTIKLLYFFYLVVAVCFTYFLVLSTNIDRRLKRTEEWVAGQYGKYCYDEASVPSTITKPVYFGNLDDCLEFVNNIDL